MRLLLKPIREDGGRGPLRQPGLCASAPPLRVAVRRARFRRCTRRPTAESMAQSRYVPCGHHKLEFGLHLLSTGCLGARHADICVVAHKGGARRIQRDAIQRPNQTSGDGRILNGGGRAVPNDNPLAICLRAPSFTVVVRGPDPDEGYTRLAESGVLKLPRTSDRQQMRLDRRWPAAYEERTTAPICRRGVGTEWSRSFRDDLTNASTAVIVSEQGLPRAPRSLWTNCCRDRSDPIPRPT